MALALNQVRPWGRGDVSDVEAGRTLLLSFLLVFHFFPPNCIIKASHNEKMPSLPQRFAAKNVFACGRRPSMHFYLEWVGQDLVENQRRKLQFERNILVIVTMVHASCVAFSESVFTSVRSPESALNS